MFVFISLVTRVDVAPFAECVAVDGTGLAARVLAAPVNDCALVTADPGAACRHSGLDPLLLLGGGRCLTL